MENQESLEAGRDWKLWPQLRKFLVLQVKLYIDAFRDICISGLAAVAFVLDLLTQNSGPESYFERVMALGRRTERAINLFHSYDPAQDSERNVDSILKDVEDRLRREGRKRDA